jgi:hypothetical protein
LRYLGPSYAFFGLGLSLSFALQGAAQVGIPVCAAILRPVIISVAVLAGFIQTLFGLYAVAAAAIVAYGVINFAGFLLRPLPTPKPL